MKGPLIYYEIKDIYGSNLSSIKFANELKQNILGDIDTGFNVEIDFKGVTSLSSGWIKNALGVIVKEKGEDFFNSHILLSNLSKSLTKSVGKILV
jgi:hypothetical protein